MFTAEQAERLKRASAFEELKGHPGYQLFMAEVRQALANTWGMFLSERPEDLPRLQAWAQGVQSVLQIADEAVLDRERVVQEAEAQAEKDRRENQASQQFQHQRVERGRNLGARI